MALHLKPTSEDGNAQMLALTIEQAAQEMVDDLVDTLKRLKQPKLEKLILQTAARKLMRAVG